MALPHPWTVVRYVAAGYSAGLGAVFAGFATAGLLGLSDNLTLPPRPTAEVVSPDTIAMIISWGICAAITGWNAMTDIAKGPDQ